MSVFPKLEAVFKFLDLWSLITFTTGDLGGGGGQSREVGAGGLAEAFAFFFGRHHLQFTCFFQTG